MNDIDVAHWLKIVEVGLIASVKFLFAPFEAERYNFSFWESFAVTTIGGLVGIFVFYYAGSKLTTWWRHIVALIKSLFMHKPVEVIERKHRKVFTRGRRFIIGIKMKFGLVGVAFVTPCLISIPIGTIVAANFYRKKRNVMLYFIISLLFWSLLLNGIAQYLGLSQYIVIPK
ncbi:MAG: hypothetical protein NT084_14115 [Bacteroidetes bacterium]|jgi:hypothetical protein|nr:hypothetical protein [Bacteroidota bacterium]